jgi:hypothetical protein
LSEVLVFKDKKDHGTFTGNASLNLVAQHRNRKVESSSEDRKSTGEVVCSMGEDKGYQYR